METSSLTVLGSEARRPIEHVEVFPAPDHVTDEADRADVVRDLPQPGRVAAGSARRGRDGSARRWQSLVLGPSCVESKSLKLYLWHFRDRAVFAEALAAEIANEIFTTAAARRVTVTLTQRPRGGIAITAVAERLRER